MKDLKTNNKYMHITVTKEIHNGDIANLLDEASRGSAYWCNGAGELAYESMTKAILGGTETLTLTDMENDEQAYTLDLKAVERGLQVMADKFPKYFADIGGDSDASTGDVFLQCALLGDVIYG